MTEAVGIDDAAIRAMLEGRAARLRPATIDAAALVSSVRRVRPPTPWPVRMSFAAAAAAIVLATGLLVVLPRPSPPASTGPSGSSVSEAPPPRADGVRFLTVAELGELARTRSEELSPRLAVTRGRLTIEPDPRCTPTSCLMATLEGSGEGFLIRMAPEVREAALFAARGPRTVDLVVRFTTQIDVGRPVVEVLGELNPGLGGAVAWSPSVLRASAAGDPGSYAAVDGWLVPTPPQSCASIPATPAPTGMPIYQRCGERDFLTDEAFQPVGVNGQIQEPAGAIEVPLGSYPTWAPDPAVQDGRFAPRHAVYLLQRGDIACPSGGECPANVVDRWGIIVGRLEPVPEAAPRVEPSTSQPASSESMPGSIGGEPVLVGPAAQARIESATDDTSFLVGVSFDGPIACGGGPDPDPDPNPLAFRGCQRYAISGVLARMLFPLSFPWTPATGPIVLRVHRNDPGAETCRSVALCRRILVVELIEWSGVSGLGPG